MATQRLEFAWLSDRGRVRARNEDAVAVHPDIGLVMVADGIGGANAGDVASRLAIEAVERYIRSAGRPPADSKEALRRAEAAVAAANRAIWEAARATPRYAGMGTTLVVGTTREQRLTFAHVGDSRLYRLRDRALLQLTGDHSLIQDVVDQGFFRTLEDARRYGINQNILTRALGTANDVQVDSDEEELLAGDLYLFCTDGLTGMVADEDIREILLRAGDALAPVSRSLVDRACERGGLDNITVALMRVS